jgi:hypothetical protein
MVPNEADDAVLRSYNGRSACQHRECRRGGPRPPEQSKPTRPTAELLLDCGPEQAFRCVLHGTQQVLTSPRCLNCHPAGDRPRQGDSAHLHQPPVYRGKDGLGLESMRCRTCHLSANFDPGRVPGHAKWQLAPIEMAWEGKTVSEICQQIKDPTRNGNRSLKDLVEHIGKDTLVGWAWNPGYGRTPAPGTQQQAGALAAAWVRSGDVCP